MPFKSHHPTKIVVPVPVHTKAKVSQNATTPLPMSQSPNPDQKNQALLNLTKTPIRGILRSSSKSQNAKNQKISHKRNPVKSYNQFEGFCPKQFRLEKCSEVIEYFEILKRLAQLGEKSRKFAATQSSNKKSLGLGEIGGGIGDPQEIKSFELKVESTKLPQNSPLVSKFWPKNRQKFGGIWPSNFGIYEALEESIEDSRNGRNLCVPPRVVDDRSGGDFNQSLSLKVEKNNIDDFIDGVQWISYGHLLKPKNMGKKVEKEAEARKMICIKGGNSKEKKSVRFTPETKFVERNEKSPFWRDILARRKLRVRNKKLKSYPISYGLYGHSSRIGLNHTHYYLVDRKPRRSKSSKSSKSKKPQTPSPIRILVNCVLSGLSRCLGFLFNGPRKNDSEVAVQDRLDDFVYIYEKSAGPGCDGDKKKSDEIPNVMIINKKYIDVPVDKISKY